MNEKEDHAMQPNLTTRILILFAAVGSIAFLMPTDPQAADSQPVSQPWGSLPLNVSLKAMHK